MSKAKPTHMRPILEAAIASGELTLSTRKASNWALVTIDDLTARLAETEARLAANHPESWARITKRLRDERDIARQIARNLLRALRKHEDVPGVDEEFLWLIQE